MSDTLYEEIQFKPVPALIYGKCPMCSCENSKIVFGWHGSYYDMICENGHQWKYTFPKKKVEAVCT